jgi:hypothetical protein
LIIASIAYEGLVEYHSYMSSGNEKIYRLLTQDTDFLLLTMK